MEHIPAIYRESQRRASTALAAQSQLCDVDWIDEWHCLVRFGCTGLVLGHSGRVEKADRFEVGIWLPDHYLEVADPAQVLTWLGPLSVFHPNIRPPFICVGPIAPGEPVESLLYRCFDVITYRNVTVREDDALNVEACGWARRNLERFPVDDRPLKWMGGPGSPTAAPSGSKGMSR